jgi:putative tricarboxylic transport membrane protein
MPQKAEMALRRQLVRPEGSEAEGDVNMVTNDSEAMTRDNPSRVKAFIGPILTFLLAVFLYVLAGHLDENPVEGQLGAFFWPKALLILLMASCGLKILESFFAFGKGVADAGLEGPSAEIDNRKLAVMIVMVLAAVFLVENIGFALANFLFLLGFMRIAGLKRKLPLFLISFLGTVFLLYLFVKIVYLPLPKGQWFFDDVTIAIYRFLHII